MCGVLCDLFFSCNIMLLRVISLVACIINYCWVMFHCVYCKLFIHLLVDGHLGCFQLRAIMNTEVYVNICFLFSRIKT
jgi:hypothetical protein